MEVKPVGRERDRQIAELKNIPFVEDYLNLTHVKEWSISLTDAWELWEEMTQRGDMFSVLDRQHISLHDTLKPYKIVRCMLYDSRGKEKGRRWKHKGVDEPDAISGAWVKWKGEGK